MVRNSNEETNFPHKLLLTSEAFVNGSSANIKLSKIQLSNMMQLGGYLFGLIGVFFIK